jgi:small subunit ribosomal protein S14
METAGRHATFQESVDLPWNGRGFLLRWPGILPEFRQSAGKIREKATLGLQPCAHPVTPAPRIMAKKSWIARNARKKQTVEKYAELRLKLKAEKDYVGLSMLPRDASPTRLVNRCEITGRRRAFLRRFRLSRITFRELASAGMLPGVTKSSW